MGLCSVEGWSPRKENKRELELTPTSPLLPSSANSLSSTSKLFESLSEVTTKHAKLVSKEVADLNSVLSKHFKKLSVRPPLHTSRSSLQLT